MKVLCSTEESLYRPEALRWRKRMRLLNPLGEGLVILPCSMKKPYSHSKSHQIFRKATRPIQEVILTSPFGICPREMENTYPIQSYDVTTTGDWSNEEMRLVGELLKDYVTDKKVIAHVTGAYRKVCEEYLDEAIYTCKDGKPLSPSSMNELKQEVKKFDKISPREKLIKGLRSIALYQFGKDGEVLIPSDIQIKGRYNKRIFHENEQLATLLMDTGLFAISLAGGKLLAGKDIKIVEIDFELKTNTLFSPGVIHADENIVPRDEVIIRRNGEVVGVGKSILSGEEMVRASKGVAVRIRHRIKK